MAQPYRLITMAASHFCEKARWALERARVPFREERHMPGFHAFASVRAGGRHSVPVLVTDSGTLSTSSEILELADRQCGGHIYGLGTATRREARELSERFDEPFGPDTRRIIYCYLLDNRPAVASLFSDGAPALERGASPIIYPLLKRFMRRSMRITPEGAKRSRVRIHETFDCVAKRLSDGRRYLVGDQLTAADLTFASLAAPVILPHGYGAPVPPLEQLPSGLADEIRGFRDTVAGEFVLRIYREDRHKRLPPSGEDGVAANA